MRRPLCAVRTSPGTPPPTPEMYDILGTRARSRCKARRLAICAALEINKASFGHHMLSYTSALQEPAHIARSKPRVQVACAVPDAIALP